MHVKNEIRPDTRRTMPRRRQHITAGNEPLIGKRIAILRLHQGLTQVALAAKLGMSQPLLSRYERGELRLHGGLIAELAKALNVPSDEILGLAKPKKNGFRPVKDRRLLNLVQDVDRLPSRDRQTLVKTIERFLKGSRPD